MRATCQPSHYGARLRPQRSLHACPAAQHQGLQRSLHACSAASTPALLTNLQHAVNEELVIEGALHTTALQAGSCLTRFSELQQLAEGQAPPPQALDVSHAKAAAVCIATPSEPDEEADNIRFLRSQLRHASSSMNNLSSRAKDLLASSQRNLESSSSLGLEPADAWQQLQAADVLRRRRRAAYLVTLRKGQRRLGAVVSSLTSLSSVDDLVVGPLAALGAWADNSVRRE